VLLYFIATGVAFINDKRRGRDKEVYAGLDDDELSPLTDDRQAVDGSDPIEAPSAVGGPSPVGKPLPLEGRFDDIS
jgi:sec-independent protein translocase protein TatC